jgi:Cation/multidrug efflux pump
VRGFITTPLERVIASADGIDYMESSSAQGVSTITVHLKLNYDTNAALTQLQAKVAQVRNDLPPEAEAPIIDMQTADNQFAAIYLGFSAKDLDPNQVTDYLTRVVQPKLSAINGVQRADILGARTFAMRIWLKPDRWRRSASRRPPSASAGPQQLPVGGGADQGSMVRSTCGEHRLRTAAEFRSWSSSSRAASSCGSARSPTSCSAPRTTSRTCGSTASRRRSWASGCCRRRTRST